MSAFLGPIHTWLYNKILFQEGLTIHLLESVPEQKEQLLTQAKAFFSEPERGDLAEIVDPANIHGWLQERVSRVEARLAYVVTTLVSEDPARMTELIEEAQEYGRLQAPKEVQTPESAYRLLENTLLNGMPCDHVNRIVEQDDTTLVWEQTTDIHAPFWYQVEGNPLWYQELRAGVIDGLLEESGVDCLHSDGIWKLSSR